MPSIKNKTIIRRELPLFLIVDCSDSMRFTITIDELNDIVNEIVKDFDNLSEDYDIRVGLLTYGKNVNWIGDGLVPIKDFCADIHGFCGLSDIGNAFDELNKRMSRNAFLRNEDSCFYIRPTVFFISDGCSTDDYYEPLKKLKANRWFKESVIICVSTGNSTNLFVDIAGSSEVIITLNPYYSHSTSH